VKLEHINIGSIWTMLTGAVLCVVYMFNTFATAEDLKEQAEELKQEVGNLELSISYGQFYDRLDDRDEAEVEENEELAKEYERQMERLKAKICEDDPEWERCDDE
jgi:hypothetical protein